MRAKVLSGHHRLDFLQAAVGAVHLAAGADHGRHRGVDDDVAGRMEVGDALGRIDHRQFRPVLVAGVEVAHDLVALRLGQRGDLVVQVDHAVVDVHAQLVEQLAVLLERVLVEDPHAVAEHDRVRHLHHRGLDVQREHHAGLARVLDLALVERRSSAFLLMNIESMISPSSSETLGFSTMRLAALGDELHLHVARAGPASSTSRRGRSRRRVMCDTCVREAWRPFGHRVRVLARVFLDRARRAAVGVAFAQHRVDGRADALGVARLDRLFFVGLRVARGSREPCSPWPAVP